ncbi:MAG: gamma-glutamyltransferase family protein, partial [Planctomycetota bacterium]
PSGQTMDALRSKLKERGLTEIPKYGALPITIPGCVDGWCELQKRFGKRTLAQNLEPTIQYARQGFPVAQTIAYYWRASERLKRFPGFAETFLPGGRAPREGELFRNPMLANTLQQIGEQGRDAFYDGANAETMAKFLQENGSAITVDDFRNHRSEWVAPVSTDYRGWTVYELPPNGQGIAALQMLGILRQFDIAKMGYGSVDYVHHFTEAKKLAFEDRAAFYADMDFADVPVQSLIGDKYARQRSALIGDNASVQLPAGQPVVAEQGDTIYLTVADPDRNMVSLIQSNYRGMGSGLCPPGLGFCFQDRGELFDMTPGRANSYAPGKRPFHTIIPAFAKRGDDFRFSFGVMGGATQPQGHVQIMVNMADFGMNVQEAGDAPRMLHSGSSQPTGSRMNDGGTLALERGYDPNVIDALKKKGHRMKYAKGSFGGYQGILYDVKRGVYQGASESRKDGQAAGW